jgi:hypothetical protein
MRLDEALWSHFDRLTKDSKSASDRLATVVPILKGSNFRRSQRTAGASSLAELEAENAELRRTAITLALQIQHLQLARSRARRSCSTV